MDKNQVIVRNVTEQERNVHLAIHPFQFGVIAMMSNKGDYGRRFNDGEEMILWQREMADALWDGIPGLSTLFFVNGGVTLQHNGLFNDAEVIDEATKIITPFLMTNRILNDIDEEKGE